MEEVGFVYNNLKTYNDKKSAVGLHICHIVNTIIELFITTFLVGYIYSYCVDIYDYITKVATYELTSYISFLVVYLIASKLVNITNRVSVYRLSTLLWGIYIIFFIFFGTQISDLLIIAGFLCGISRGFYWSSFNVLKQEMVGKKAMGNFATLSLVLQKLVSVVFPITLGTLVDKISYGKTAIIIFYFCLIQVVVSFMIDSKRPQNSDFDLKKYFDRLKTNDDLSKRLKFLYFITIFYAFNTIVSTLIYVCIMIQFGSNAILGKITSYVSVAVIITTILVGQFTKPAKRDYVYIISSILAIVSVILFVLKPCDATVIIFYFAIGISTIIYKLIFDVFRNKFLKEYGRYDDIAEHQAVVESTLQISRIFSYVLLLVIALFKTLILFYILLVVLTAISSFTLILLLIFEKKFFKNKEVINKDNISSSQK